MTDTQDLYAILGVPPNATTDDIHRAYRNAARRLHPDVNKNPGAATQFRSISTAYTVLNDAEARTKYDATRSVDQKTYFTLRITPSKRILPVLDEPQVLYMLVELLPSTRQSVTQFASHLNLTLVLDHSTSMKGQRLDRTKVAAYQIIDQLSEEDYLSIITFSDRAEVLVPAAKVSDKSALKATVMIAQASGGTEIFQGLDAGLQENRRNASPRYVNHIILLTDGRTYGDEIKCLELAEQGAKQGIGISAMGIGDEWNDVFLDNLASRTGGTSEYITSPNAVVQFLNERVRALGKSFAERVMLSLAPDPDIKIESAFRLSPNAQPLPPSVDPIPLGQLQALSSTSIILQLQVPPVSQPGFRSLLRAEVTCDIMSDQKIGHKVIADISTELSIKPPPEEPPLLILDALGKLTLYRMQEKANDAIARGDVREATRRLQTLATRLFEVGQEDLASAAQAEAQRVSTTHMLSEEGQKTLKYGTRMLVEASSDSVTEDST